MAQTITALYESISDARQVVDELMKIGFDRDGISLIASDLQGEHAVTLKEGKVSEGEGPRDVMAKGAVTGGALGGIAGFLLGMTPLLLPGFGAVLVAGPILAIYGALAGTISGGLLGLLIKAGIPEEEADYYAEGIRRGLTLVSVEAGASQSDRVVRIMDAYNPVDIAEQAKEWREAGWTGYSDEAGAATVPEGKEKSHRYATGEMNDAAYGRNQMQRGPALPDYDQDVDRRD